MLSTVPTGYQQAFVTGLIHNVTAYSHNLTGYFTGRVSIITLDVEMILT